MFRQQFFIFMIETFLIQKIIRLKRYIAEFGLFRVLFLLFIFLSIYISFIRYVNNNTYSFLIILIVYTLIIITYTNKRKDSRFLQNLTPKYKILFWIDDLLFSLPFIILDYRTIPFVLIISILIILLNFKFPHFSIRRKKTFFMDGSIEWISAFRTYNKYTLPIWLLFFIFTLVQSNQVAATISLIILIIDNSVFFLDEKIYYVKQYLGVQKIIIDKIKRLYLNSVFPLSLFYILFSIYFNIPSGAFFLGFINFNIYYLGALFIKLSLIPSGYYTHAIFIGLYMAVFISSFYIPIFSIALIFIFILSFIFAVKNLKTIYECHRSWKS